jgi:hypothetical protein
VAAAVGEPVAEADGEGFGEEVAGERGGGAPALELRVGEEGELRREDMTEAIS